MTLSEILNLFEYDGWATHRTFDAVSSLSEPKYLEGLRSSHGGIHGTLVHLYSADWIWLQRWKGASPPAHVEASEIPNLDSLKKRWEQYHAERSLYLGKLTEEVLATSREYHDLKGNRQSEPLFQQMLHCVNHASYHRGQVVTMLRQQGGKPIGTDLIAFYRERPAKAGVGREGSGPTRI